MEKNQEFTVTIEDMNEDGAGVGKLDGYIWFIKDTVIGDVVRAKAMTLKKSYGFARTMDVLRPASEKAGSDHINRWICTAYGGAGAFHWPCGTALSGGPPVRGLSASGHELRRAAAF